MASINVAHRTKAEKRAVEKKEDPDKPDRETTTETLISE